MTGRPEPPINLQNRRGSHSTDSLQTVPGLLSSCHPDDGHGQLGVTDAILMMDKPEVTDAILMMDKLEVTDVILIMDMECGQTGSY